MLRLGFFASREEAEKVRGTLRSVFPQAMVTLVSEEEKKVAEKRALRAKGEAAKGAPLKRKKGVRRNI